jgi:thioesterase domain-containing protein
VPDTLSEPGYATFDLTGRPEPLRAVLRTLYAAMTGYRPEPSHLDLTVLCADSSTPGTADDLGWSRLVGRKVATFPIPGDHLSITVEADAAARIAQVLQAAMAEAEDAT